MDWILLAVLCVLAGILGWIGWELRAVRKTLQARYKDNFKPSYPGETYLDRILAAICRNSGKISSDVAQSHQ